MIKNMKKEYKNFKNRCHQLVILKDSREMIFVLLDLFCYFSLIFSSFFLHFLSNIGVESPVSIFGEFVYNSFSIDVCLNSCFLGKRLCNSDISLQLSYDLRSSNTNKLGNLPVNLSFSTEVRSWKYGWTSTSKGFNLYAGSNTRILETRSISSGSGLYLARTFSHLV
jgi:hypothetical protein